jgi:transcriptional regulator with XRE-family HTH domain
MKDKTPVDIPAGIALLRRRLGDTQFALATRLGIREQNIQRWEGGTAVPRGDVLLKMIQLCPDRETLRAFGVEIPPDQPRSTEGTRAPVSTMGGAKKKRVEGRPA